MDEQEQSRPATDPKSYDDVRVRFQGTEVVKVLACSSCYEKGYSQGFAAALAVMLITLGVAYVVNRYFA